MAITVDGLRSRLGLTAESDQMLETVISDTLGTIRVLTGVKRFSEDLDGFLYGACIDVYRSVGYGSASAPAPVASVKDKDQTVQFSNSKGSISAVNVGDILSANHKDLLRRIRKVRW